MENRMTVQAMAEDVYRYYLKNRIQFDKKHGPYTSKGITNFIEQAVNEPLPDNKTNMLSDVGVVYNNHTRWSLKKIKEYASKTVGLEEQFRFFQLFCQPARGGAPYPLPASETPLMCSYFKSRWHNQFPTRQFSIKPASRIPVQIKQVEDADTFTVCFDKECHVARLAGIDSQESVEINDLVTEKRAQDIKSTSETWNIKDTYCYDHPIKKSKYCVLRAEIPNSKMLRQANDAWSALIRIVNTKDKALAEKLKNKALKNSMAPAGKMATKYRGKIATLIVENLLQYAKDHHTGFDVEPSYAVPDAWNDDTKNNGRLEGIGKYGRLLLWIDIRRDKKIFVKYLLDKKNGLTPFARGKLHEFYRFNRAQIRKELGNINFKQFGINAKDEKAVKKLFLSLVINPSKTYSASRTKRMAKGWEKLSTGLTFYKYPDNLNLFEEHLGTALDTPHFPNIRGITTWKLRKEAAKAKNGLFQSPVFFQRYATKKQREEQLKKIK